jgi:hypothetical protein
VIDPLEKEKDKEEEEEKDVMRAKRRNETERGII